MNANSPPLPARRSRRYLPFFAIVVVMLAGCTTGSYVLTGTVRPKIAPEDVRIYTEPPPGSQQIGLLSVFNNGAWTWQQGKNRCIEYLKKKAAEIGANAIVLTGSQDDYWSGSTVQATAFFLVDTPSGILIESPRR